MNKDYLCRRCEDFEKLQHQYLKQYFDKNTLYERKGLFVVQGISLLAQRRCCLIKDFIQTIAKKKDVVRQLNEYNGLYETLRKDYKEKNDDELKKIIIFCTSKEKQILKKTNADTIKILNEMAFLNKKRCAAITELCKRRNFIANHLHLPFIQKVVGILNY